MSRQRFLAHAHSDWSYDSALSLSTWITIAGDIGCDGVLLTEHEEPGWTPARYESYVAACQQASTAQIRLIPGLEFNQDGFHLLCYGLRRLPSRPSTAAQLAAAVHDQGCLLSLAHPGKYHWTYPDDLLRAVDAVEVWNSKWIYDGPLGSHPRSLALAVGKRLMVGQDVHRVKHLSKLLVETATDQVVDDLRDGRYSFVFGRQQWTQQELRSRHFAGAAQRCRTMLMQRALRGRRFLRRIARRSSGSAPSVTEPSSPLK